MIKITETVSRKTVRAVGVLYVLIIVLGIFKVNYIEPKFLVESKAVTTSLLSNDGFFRLGIGCDIIMYLFVILLSILLFLILKPIHHNLAFSALIFRVGEALIGVVVTMISGFIPLELISHGGIYQQEPIISLIDSFQALRGMGLYVVLIFVGIGGTLFLSLFYTARLVPRLLAIWGIFTYVSMLLLGFAALLFPNGMGEAEPFLYAFGALFELIFGLWLLFKGLNMEQWHKHSQLSKIG